MLAFASGGTRLGTDHRFGNKGDVGVQIFVGAGVHEQIGHPLSAIEKPGYQSHDGHSADAEQNLFNHLMLPLNQYPVHAE